MHTWECFGFWEIFSDIFGFCSTLDYLGFFQIHPVSLKFSWIFSTFLWFFRNLFLGYYFRFYRVFLNDFLIFLNSLEFFGIHTDFPGFSRIFSSFLRFFRNFSDSPLFCKNLTGFSWIFSGFSDSSGFSLCVCLGIHSDSFVFSWNLAGLFRTSWYSLSNLFYPLAV